MRGATSLRAVSNAGRAARKGMWHVVHATSAAAEPGLDDRKTIAGATETATSSANHATQATMRICGRRRSSDSIWSGNGGRGGSGSRDKRGPRGHGPRVCGRGRRRSHCDACRSCAEARGIQRHRAHRARALGRLPDNNVYHQRPQRDKQ